MTKFGHLKSNAVNQLDLMLPDSLQPPSQTVSSQFSPVNSKSAQSQLGPFSSTCQFQWKRSVTSKSSFLPIWHLNCRGSEQMVYFLLLLEAPTFPVPIGSSTVRILQARVSSSQVATRRAMLAKALLVVSLSTQLALLSPSRILVISTSKSTKMWI